ncbi:MAG: OmpA family protein [Ignavibacteriales bacterium]|nr:OmpA family protein [Ignavibacteriales bacterium]
MNAQTDSSLLNSAHKFFEEENYPQAISLYEKIYDSEPENVFVAFRLAESYRFIRDYQTAKDFYEDVLDLNVPEYSRAQYWLALCLKTLEEYDEAKNEFEKIANDTSDFYNTLFIARSRKEIDACAVADSLKKNPLRIRIKNLGAQINSTYSDFAAIPFDSSSLLFTSTRRNIFDTTTTNKISAQLFQTTKINSEWSVAREIEALNDSQFYTGNGAFSPDGKRLYFTRCQQSEMNTLECFLYVSKFENGKWQTSQPLNDEINLQGYIATQPTIANGKRGEQILYFVSNRPGGFGGNDIWYSTISRDGIFSPPKNCGNVINTSENEASPYYHQRTRALYFSSEGHRGCGGFDIFQSEGALAKWSEVKNLGYPLNSGVDDIFFSANVFLGDGFLTSNRDGGMKESGQTATCCDDIYSYHWITPPKVMPVVIITGNVKDSSSQEILEDVDVSLVDVASGEEVDGERTLPNKNFLFQAPSENNYRIIATKSGYLSLSKKIDTQGVSDNDTLNIEMTLEKISLYVGQILSSIRFEFGRTDLTPEFQSSLDTVATYLKQHPTIIVEVGAHTDNKGSDEFNAGLSQSRALNVIHYFLKLGIKSERLMFRAYSESQPIAPNENPDGSDNPEGRKLNRRTEVKVLDIKMKEE